MEQNQQEMIFKLQMYEQQMQHLQKQLQAIEQGILEMTQLSLGLDELVGSKDKEIFAPIGRGIFAKAKLLSEELAVDVGGGNIIKKSIPETKKIIEKQVKKLDGIKKDIEDALEGMNKEILNVIDDAQKQNVEGSEKGNEHTHGHDCDCSDGEECDCGDDCTCDEEGECDCGDDCECDDEGECGCGHSHGKGHKH